MRSPADLPWPLLDRYFAGEATPDERHQIDAYFARHPERARVSREIADTLRTQSPPVSTDISSMLAAAHARIAAPQAALRRFIQKHFDGSVQQAVAALLDLADTELSDQEVAELRRSIQQAQEEGR